MRPSLESTKFSFNFFGLNATNEALCQQGKSFGNKIWNSFRLIKGWEVKKIEQPLDSSIALEWYYGKFQKALIEIEDHFNKYRLSDALMTIYKLIWDDYCSWLLEIIKPSYGDPIDKKLLMNWLI